MTAKIIDGKKIAQETISEIKETISKTKTEGKNPPGLAVIQIGENPEIKIKELAELCFSVVGKKLSIDLKPASSGSPVRRQPNMSLTHRLTGFESQINLKDGITITYEWYRKNVFKGTSVTAK